MIIIMQQIKILFNIMYILYFYKRNLNISNKTPKLLILG